LLIALAPPRPPSLIGRRSCVALVLTSRILSNATFTSGFAAVLRPLVVRDIYQCAPNRRNFSV
jgi:hypothetical protein